MAVVNKKLPPSAGPVRRKAEPVASPGVFRLPTERSVPPTSLWAYRWLVFGDKKIGKTTLGSKAPDAVFLATEPGTRALSVFEVAITNWLTFTSAVKALEQDSRFHTVVVDTVDHLYKMCEKAVGAKMGFSHPSEEDWGRGWSAIRDEFTMWIQRLMLLNKGIMFISHATEKEIKTRSGEKYDRIQPTMANQARDLIEGMVDIWAYYTYRGQERVLVIRGDEHISAGHRLPNNFQTPKGAEIREIRMGPTADAGYANLLLAFENKYDVPVLPVENAGPVTPKKVVRRVS